jgi:hypothetical protein
LRQHRHLVSRVDIIAAPRITLSAKGNENTALKAKLRERDYARTPQNQPLRTSLANRRP